MTLYDFLLKIIGWGMRLLNGKPQFYGLENLPKDEPFILAGTHHSLQDPILLALLVYPQKAAFMAKNSLFNNRFLAWVFTKLHVFPVDRDKPSPRTLRHATDVMNKEQMILGIFPTGTRHSEKVKGGTAFIQRLSKRPIVPVAMDTSVGFKEFILRKNPKIAVGTPIVYEEGVKYDKDKLAQVDAQIAQCFKELNDFLKVSGE